MLKPPVIEEVPGAEIPTEDERPPGAPLTTAPPSYRISFVLRARSATVAELSLLRNESRAPEKAAAGGDFLSAASFRHPGTGACEAMPPELVSGTVFPNVEMRAEPSEGGNEVRIEFWSSERKAVEPVLQALAHGLSVRIGLGTQTSGTAFAVYRLRLTSRAPYTSIDELEARQCVSAERWVGA